MNEDLKVELSGYVDYLERLKNSLKNAIKDLCSEDSTSVSRAFFNLGTYVENLSFQVRELEDRLADEELEEDDELEKTPKDDEYVSFESLKTVIDKLLKGKCCGQKD